VPADATPSRTTIKPTVWLTWLIALVMLTIAYRVADGVVWFGQDDASYFDAAEHLLSGETITRVHHHYARMSLIVPTTISVALFGPTPLTVALPTIIVSVLLPIVVALLGRLVWGWWEGLCAASIVTLLPYVRSLGTTTLPDMHALFFTTLAVVLVLLAARAQSRRAVIALAFAAGFTLGWAASAKIFSLSAGPFMLLMFVHQRRQQGGSSLVGVTSLILGGVALWLVDGLFFLYVADDFFFKWHALKSAQGKDVIFTNPVASWVDYARVAYDRVTLLLTPTASRWGWIALAFWPAAVWTLWRGRGRLIALWAIAAYAFLALAPVRFDGWPQPYPCFSTRVAITTCVPFALCVAWVARHLMSERFYVEQIRQTADVLLPLIS